jgi:hypothetical protein
MDQYCCARSIRSHFGWAISFQSGRSGQISEFVEGNKEMKLGMGCKENYAAYVKEKMSMKLRKAIVNAEYVLINHIE